MTALNQQVLPTLRMPTGHSSLRIQSAGLQLSPWASQRFLFTRAALSSTLASSALEHIKTCHSSTVDNGLIDSFTWVVFIRHQMEENWGGNPIRKAHFCFLF
jgi:hypothetical protein